MMVEADLELVRRKIYGTGLERPSGFGASQS